MELEAQVQTNPEVRDPAPLIYQITYTEPSCSQNNMEISLAALYDGAFAFAKILGNENNFA